MNLERALRLVAGFLVLVSLGLGHYHSPYWLFLTLVVGFNLFQSGFTNWCPMKSLLKFCGLKSCEEKIARLKEGKGHE